MTALRDDMTLAEAQAEAERRWPGARMDHVGPTQEAQYDEFDLSVTATGPHYYAGTPVGCLDQAIAAENRRKAAESTARQEVIIRRELAAGRGRPECICGEPWSETFGAACVLHPGRTP